MKELSTAKINWGNVKSRYNLLFIFIIFIVVSIFTSEYFLTYTNITNIIKQSTTIGLLACGATLVMLLGEIDLSVGSMVAMNSVIFATFAPYGLWVTVIISLLSTTILGFINGVLVSKAKLPSFIVTFAMMGIARSIGLTIAKGEHVYGVPENFNSLVNASIGLVPVIAILLLLIYLILHVFLNYTYTGRTIYATGTDSNSAKLCGINIDRVRILAFTLSGLFAGLGGLVFTARVTVGMPEGGVGYELEAITASIIGGVSLFGGVGEIYNTLIGVLILGVLHNIMNLIGISPFVQYVVNGVVILVAVILRISQERAK